MIFTPFPFFWSHPQNIFKQVFYTNKTDHNKVPFFLCVSMQNYLSTLNMWASCKYIFWSNASLEFWLFYSFPFFGAILKTNGEWTSCVSYSRRCSVLYTGTYFLIPTLLSSPVKILCLSPNHLATIYIGCKICKAGRPLASTPCPLFLSLVLENILNQTSLLTKLFPVNIFKWNLFYKQFFIYFKPVKLDRL
jgi:hypothetical protein